MVNASRFCNNLLIPDWRFWIWVVHFKELSGRIVICDHQQAAVLSMVLISVTSSSPFHLALKEKQRNVGKRCIWLSLRKNEHHLVSLKLIMIPLFVHKHIGKK